MKQMSKRMNRYSVLEYIQKRSGRLSKNRGRECDACRIEASKILREMEINMLAEKKPDPKAYERFKRKPYSVGGDKSGIGTDKNIS